MLSGKVIGLGSLPGAGKGELAEQLSRQGVQHLHVGTLVRSTANDYGFAPVNQTREAYLPFWAEHAKTHRNNWLAKIAFKIAHKQNSIVLLDGVRIPADAQSIAQANNGTMAWLQGDLPTLANRVLSRQRIEDEGIRAAEDYVDAMQKELDGKGNFSMGAVRNASEVFLLPIPDIADLDNRSAYYGRLASHLLAITYSM